MDVILYSLGLSLFDSLSTTVQIVVFVLLLTTEKPVRNAIAYLVGLSGAYFACGAAGYLVLDQLRAFLAQFMPSLDNLPGTVYYRSEGLTGVILAALGAWYYFRNRKPRPNRTPNWILQHLKTMTAWFAVGVGAFISVTSFPVSLPYLAALGRYASLHLGLPAAAPYILLYNLGYAAPMLLILLLYLKLRRDTVDLHDHLHRKADLLNIHLTAWTFAGCGILCLLDAACYFILGHGLLKERFF